MATAIMWTAALLLLLLLSFSTTTTAFSLTTTVQQQQQSVPRQPTCLHAKKKRRRKPVAEDTTASSNDGDDDLPDFELPEERTPTKKPSTTTSISNNPDEITVNMMGRSQPSARSVSELIQDRRLEQTFEFDDDEAAANAEDLPDLVGMMQNMPSKKERRKQAAIARDAAAAEAQAEILQLPFELTNEKGEIQFNKVLEVGAWTGIGLLIVWEIYINSPFFERAAPMAPVVYEAPPMIQ